jgi:hypothetical protein
VVVINIDVLLLTNGNYMNRAISNNTTDEVSILRSVKKMTISELNELSSNIQEFLNSQEVKMSSNTGKVKIKSQEIFSSIGVEKLTRNELEQTRLKVQEILISHNMKFIKNMKPSRPDRIASGIGFTVYTQC